MVVLTAKSFANSFWGRDDIGYEVLTSKMSNAKKTCDDLKALYNLKATLYDDLGRKLLKHVRMGIGREETGTLRELLEASRREIELNAQANIDMGLKIRNNLELPLENFMLQQKDKRKLVQTTVEKAHRNKQLHAAYVMKAKEKYDSECAKQESLESQMTAISQRDTERIKHKLERCRAEVRTLDNEYHSACLKLTEATAIWNAEWKIACDRYQEMEEMRIEFIRSSFMTYVNITSGLSSDEKESLDRITKCIDQTDVTHDIDAFIDEQGTGPMIPEPPVYTNFFSENAESVPKYQIAKFAPLPPSMDSPMMTTRIVNPPQTSDTPPPLPPKSPIDSTWKLPIVTMIADDKATERLLQRRANLYSSSEKIKPKPTSSRKSIPVINIAGEHHSDDDGEDHAVDPRANIIVNLGGNVFEIDGTDSNDSSSDPFNTTSDQRSKRRNSRNQALDEDFDLSIRDLLQKLGVHEKKKNSKDEAKAAPMPKENQVADHAAELQPHGETYPQYHNQSASMYMQSDIPTQSQYSEIAYAHQTAYYSANPQSEDYYEQTYAYEPTTTGYYHPQYTEDPAYSTQERYYSMPSDPQSHYTYSQPAHANGSSEYTRQYSMQPQWDSQVKYSMPQYYQ